MIHPPPLTLVRCRLQVRHSHCPLAQNQWFKRARRQAALRVRTALQSVSVCFALPIVQSASQHSFKFVFAVVWARNRSLTYSWSVTYSWPVPSPNSPVTLGRSARAAVVMHRQSWLVAPRPSP